MMSMVRFQMGNKDWSIEAQAQLSLLDLAISRGVPVNYSCKRGDCGQCVASLLTGTTAPMDPARMLNGAGGIYLCNAVPCDDVAIELPYLPELESIRVVRSPCKIHELVHMSDDVLHVNVRLPPSAQFEYLPGQYIRLTNRDHATRSYSLAEGPDADRLLRIHVGRVKDGAFSRYLFGSAKPGDLLHLEGPMGQFILRDSIVARKTVFLATGTGIAPIHAILSSLAGERLRRCGDLFLYWGNRRPEDAYLREPLQGLAQRLGMHHVNVFSRTPGAQLGQAARHVQDLLAAHHPDLVDAQVFASGNAAMIDDARKCALSLGLPARQYFADSFTAS
jgi:CDP-4-dehydro-6-deoxyglucose reductase, E3